ncbi:hypothetical protein EON63_10010 [archaeon]|nr:MAG: hypothetical protein EON63_10010 [archaeon]
MRMDCPICFCAYNEDAKQPVRAFCVCSKTLCMECMHHILSSNSYCPWDKTRWGGRQVLRKFQMSTPTNYLAQLKSSLILSTTGPEHVADVACILAMEDVDIAQQSRLLAQFEQRKRASSHMAARPEHSLQASASLPANTHGGRTDGAVVTVAVKRARSISDYFGASSKRVGSTSGMHSGVAPSTSTSSSTSPSSTDGRDCSGGASASASSSSAGVTGRVDSSSSASSTGMGPALFPLWSVGRDRGSGRGKGGGMDTGHHSKQRDYANSIANTTIADEDEDWACLTCSFRNACCLPYCELCDAARGEGGDLVPSSSAPAL